MIREDKSGNPKKVIFASIREWFITFFFHGRERAHQINNILKWRHHENLVEKKESLKQFIINENSPRKRGIKEKNLAGQNPRHRRKKENASVVVCLCSQGGFVADGWMENYSFMVGELWSRTSGCSIHHQTPPKMKANE